MAVFFWYLVKVTCLVYATIGDLTMLKWPYCVLLEHFVGCLHVVNLLLVLSIAMVR